MIAALVLALGLPGALTAAEPPSRPAPAVYQVEATDWEIVPPAGFVPAEGYKGCWKPSPNSPRSGPLARNLLIRVESAFSPEACSAACARQPVPEEAIHRSNFRGRPAWSFECRERVFHFGMAWTSGDYAVVQVDEQACVIVALLARSAEARRQALPAFRQMQKTLAPLPKGPAASPAGEETSRNEVPLLR